MKNAMDRSSNDDDITMPGMIIGKSIVAIGHSEYSEPEFVREGIGPARFRTHYIFLDNDLVLDLNAYELTITQRPTQVMAAQTVGLSPAELYGRRIIAVGLDDTSSVVLILEDGMFLRDDNDGSYGNPLLAGRLLDHYTNEQLNSLTDYWTQKPITLDQ
ncbi:MAG: hypothetical protein ACF8OB_13860 [Phycisphaeraceae bacterium JB051]